MKALGFGEVLWDVVNGMEYIGGATLNVLAHLSKLGVETAIITGLGNDDRGRTALDSLEKLHLGTQFVQFIENKETGVAFATLDKTGSATYDLPLSAYDYISSTPEQIEKINDFKSDVFYFGTLAQRNDVSAKSLKNILSKINSRHIFYDVNIRMDFYPKELLETSFHFATILKINDEEALLISKRLYGVEYPVKVFVEKLAKDYLIEIILVTMGSAGCLVFNGTNSTIVPGYKVVVADTIGAGDSFSAAFLWALFQGNTPEKAVECGNLMGSYVASHSGAVPDYSVDLMESIAKYKKEK